MPIPKLIPVTASSSARHRLVVWVTLALLVPLVGSRAHARNPDTPERVPLTPLGFQTISERYLLQGATMLTVDFVDNNHLLVTFGISRLMQRLQDCPEDDDDRTVKAVLLEIPSGKELASTEWRFHDLGQYLWNLGNGQFLVRNRDNLTLIAPLQRLSSEKPANAFAQEPFLHFGRRIEAIVVSADRDLLVIETTKSKSRAAADPMLQVSTQPSAGGAPQQQIPGLRRRDPGEAAADTTPVEITFLRLLHVDAAELEAVRANPKHVPAEPAGAPSSIVARLEARIRTEKVVSIPLTTGGFLETRGESHDGVLFHFITYAGKDLDLGDFPTSCHPRPTFVSHSEFVTYGCRGSDDSLDLAGFNLRGDLIWQINFTDQQAYPSFSSAPAAGRFAFSRTITTSNVFGSETPSMSQLTAQEIRVVQMYNGKQLVRAVASPIQRAGQNYSLSPDGMTLAVIHDLPSPPVVRGERPGHDPAIELFKLPPLSAKDLTEVKTESGMAPPDADAPMRFSLKEIREALDPKTPAPGSSDADSKIVGDKITTVPAAADSNSAGHIVGDPTEPAKPASVAAGLSPAATIPTSDAGAACAGATDSSVAACPVPPSAKATSSTNSDLDASPEPEKRRKPPTLYEPAPPSPPQ